MCKHGTCLFSQLDSITPVIHYRVIVSVHVPARLFLFNTSDITQRREAGTFLSQGKMAPARCGDSKVESGNEAWRENKLVVADAQSCPIGTFIQKLP